jgi:predicted GNAT superfamily acetyltransferase
MVIKPIDTPKQANAVVQLEATVWEMDPAEAVPAHVLIAIAKNGGLLLGAYDGEKLIGFTLGWLGTADVAGSSRRTSCGFLKLVSHMTGVLPEYRDRRVGYRLKLAQREWAIERGLELVTWTYDPLESRNANLNVHRLGATCQTYLRDVYGELSDGMSVGIVSDRFEVEWWVTSERVQERLAASAREWPTLTRASAGAQVLNAATQGSDGWPRPAERPVALSAARLLVEIPANMQAIRRADLALGVAWRYHTRSIFESAFAAGYRVVDLVFERDPSFPRSFYVLERIKEEHINED